MEDFKLASRCNIIHALSAHYVLYGSFLLETEWQPILETPLAFVLMSTA